MIIRNVIRCNICGNEIESKHRHDFVTCKCGACSVGGGHDYLRRCFKEGGAIRISQSLTTAEIKNHLFSKMYLVLDFFSIILYNSD